MADIQNATGCDGELERGYKGTPMSDSGTLAAGTYYLIGAVGGGSVLDPDLVGYLYKADGTEILVSGDTATPFTFTKIGDISSWDVNVTKDKYEKTVIGNCTKGYITGLKEVTASVEGTRDLGDDEQEKVINEFMDIVKDNGLARQSTTELFLRLTVDNKSTTTGHINEFYFGLFISDTFTTASTADSKADFNFNTTVNGTDSKFALYRETVA